MKRTRNNASPSDQIKNRRKKKRKSGNKKITPRMMVPTGSTLLNLALSDLWNGGFMLGKMVNIIGDQGTGKTILSHSVMAEAAHLSRFKHYDLDHNDIEKAVEYDVAYLFGKKLAKRLNRGLKKASRTIKDFRKHVWKKINSSKPTIHALDSFDALTSDEEIERMNKEARAKKGAKVKGSFKTEKTRGLSEMLRLMIQGIAETLGLLIIVSQVRENLSSMPFAPRYRRTGGKSLEHNESYELWLAQIGKIRSKKGGPVIGVLCKVNITKNRITGKLRSVTFPIYYDLGIDDVGSCVDWLISEQSNKYWKKKGKKIVARGLGITATKKTLIKRIEEQDLEDDLRVITGEAWAKVEESLKLDRKRRYE